MAYRLARRRTRFFSIMKNRKLSETAFQTREFSIFNTHILLTS